MVQNHLSRISAPKSWQIKRKSTKWITRPMPGPHPLRSSFTLGFLLRDFLDYAKTNKEIKSILNGNNILVDGVVRKENKFPIGFMDLVEISKLGEYYRIVYNLNGKFSLVPIKKEESNIKLLMIVRKTPVKKGKLQITFHDGRNILADKFSGHVGDSVLFDLGKRYVNKILSLEPGSLVYLSGGAHIGRIGKVKQVIKAKDLQKPKVVVEIDGNEYITPTKYAFVVGKDKPEVNLEVKK